MTRLAKVCFILGPIVSNFLLHRRCSFAKNKHFGAYLDGRFLFVCLRRGPGVVQWHEESFAARYECFIVMWEWWFISAARPKTKQLSAVVMNLAQMDMRGNYRLRQLWNCDLKGLWSKFFNARALWEVECVAWVCHQLPCFKTDFYQMNEFITFI